MTTSEPIGVLVLASTPPETRPALRPKLRSPAFLAILGLVLAASCGAGSIRMGIWRRSDPTRELPRSRVARTDFSSVMTVSGIVDSPKKTVVSCELERLEIRTEGSSVSAGGASVILEVIDEGRVVEKGEVLCRLNSADYDELVINQQLKTEQSRAALKTATLNFDVAQLAVEEYRMGLARQNTQLMEGRIALAESELARATDRLKWTGMMLGKGYVPVAQRSTARQTLVEAELDLDTTRWNLANFSRFGHPRTIKELEAEVEKRRYEVIANSQRVARLEERLAHYRKMVEFCTIRAPHGGFLIYAVDPNRRGSPRLEPGVEVRQQQQLFFLPDLDQLQVCVYLHESIAGKVQEGMRVRTRIEGLQNRILEGHVLSVAPMPVSSPTWTVSDDVKYFPAVVKLDSVPNGLRPGMSAEVEIDLDRCMDVLAVPTESVTVEQGHDICYVAGVDGLERRRVTLGRSSRDLLEVTKGLAAGEEVITNPGKIEAIESLVVNEARTGEGEESTAGEASGFPPATPTVD